LALTADQSNLEPEMIILIEPTMAPKEVVSERVQNKISNPAANRRDDIRSS
jgi:hypothetical protein